MGILDQPKVQEDEFRQDPPHLNNADMHGDMHGINNAESLSMLDNINDDVDMYIDMLLNDEKYNKMMLGTEKAMCAGTGSAMHARFFPCTGTPLTGEAQAGTEKIILSLSDEIDRVSIELEKCKSKIVEETKIVPPYDAPHNSPVNGDAREALRGVSFDVDSIVGPFERDPHSALAAKQLESLLEKAKDLVSQCDNYSRDVEIRKARATSCLRSLFSRYISHKLDGPENC